MIDIGARAVVPGANDNLSAVAVNVALARAFRDDPPPGVRVILLSTGSEESFMEGMQGFMRRHRGELSTERTEFVCLECVGSPQLCVVEGEGMLRMRLYSERSREALVAAGRAAGVELRRGLRTVAATDGLISMRAGYRTCTLGRGRRDQVSLQLPLADGYSRQCELGVRRGCRCGLRGLRPRGLSLHELVDLVLVCLEDRDLHDRAVADPVEVRSAHVQLPVAARQALAKDQRDVLLPGEHVPAVSTSSHQANGPESRCGRPGSRA